MEQVANRRTDRIVAVTAVALLAGAFGAWLLAHRVSPQDAARTTSEPQAGSLAAAAQNDTAKAAPTKPASAPRPTPSAAPLDAAQQFATLSARLNEQSRDHRWAQQTEQAIVDGMARALHNTGLLEPLPMITDCRSGSCRITLRSSAQADAEMAAQWLALELAAVLPHARVLSIPGPGGQLETHILASR